MTLFFLESDPDVVTAIPELQKGNIIDQQYYNLSGQQVAIGDLIPGRYIYILYSRYENGTLEARKIVLVDTITR